MAVVTFGGAYAVLAYMAQQAVDTYHWLRPGEMLDGLGMAETTPGPLIMVVQFVGFMAAYRDPGSLPPMLAGTLGGLLATWTTFVPCFLWIGLGALFIKNCATTNHKPQTTNMAIFQNAKTYLEKAIKIGSSAVLYQHLGDIYEGLGEIVSALKYWNEALKLDPGNKDVQ